MTAESGDLIWAEAVTHHAGDDPELLMDPRIEKIFRDIPESDRYPGVHLMTGPIYLRDAKPGDILEVRYFQMLPIHNYGSNVAANWGHLYKEFDETERVTIYKLDDNHQTASAIYAYDNTGSYAVPVKSRTARTAIESQRLMGCESPLGPT